MTPTPEMPDEIWVQENTTSHYWSRNKLKTVPYIRYLRADASTVSAHVVFSPYEKAAVIKLIDHTGKVSAVVPVSEVYGNADMWMEKDASTVQIKREDFDAEHWADELAVALNRVAVMHPDGNPKYVIEEAKTVLEKYRSEKRLTAAMKGDAP